MPDGYEGKDCEGIADGAKHVPVSPRHTIGAAPSFHRSVRGGGWRAAATHWDVNVANEPAVKAAVPAAPEGEGGVIVRHAANDVLRRVDAVNEGPPAEETPGEEELQPDVV